MRDQCIAAVERVLGRPLTVAESRNIESRIKAAMRVRAGKDAAAWRAMSEPQRIIEAAKMAAKQFVFEHQKKKEREGLSAVFSSQIDGYTADQVTNSADTTRLAALHRMLRPRNDQKNNTISAESRANGYEWDAVRRMLDVFEALRPGLSKMIPWENKAIAKDVVDALNGKPTADPTIAKAVQEFRSTVDGLREAFNSAGGAIGHLDNWDMPHAWSPYRAVKAGRDRWVNDMMQWVDRSKYINVEDDPQLGVTAGDPYTDDQMRAFLQEAYLTVGTAGARADRGRPFPGGGLWANRHAEHRQIHLRPDAVFDAIQAYSEKNVLEMLIGHVRRLARDVSVIETFGPNADAMWNSKIAEYEVEAKEAAALAGDHKAIQRIDDQIKGMNADWRNFTGHDIGAGLHWAADLAYGKGMRSWQTITHLGGAAWAAFVTDPMFLRLNAAYLRLPHVQLTLNETMAFTKQGRDAARRMGLMTETVMDTLQRFAHDDINTRTILPKLAALKLQLTGVNAVTEVRRTAFGVTMMDTIGRLTREYATVADLAADDVRALKGKGITQQTWDIWRAAQLEQFRANGTLLTPAAIERVQGFTPAQKQRAVVDLLAIVSEETNIAVINPGLREQTHLSFGATPGTTMGEIAKTMTQLKSFPWSIITRHWERALAQPGYEKYMATAGLLVMSTLFGALLSWSRDLMSGKNPRNMNVTTDDPDQRSVAIRNLLGATAAGGGAGVLGDFLFGELRDPSKQSLPETLLGPAVGDYAKAIDMTAGNATKALGGQDTTLREDLTSFAQSNNPLNTWYTQSLMERMVFNQLHEAINPGYVDRMMDRQYQRQGTEYWWNPGDVADAETPDLESAWAE